MRWRRCLLVVLVCLLVLLVGAGRAAADVELVDVLTLDSSIVLDFRYATSDNFTGQVVYPTVQCLLRKPVAERLVAVQKTLRAYGLGLKLFDCYRPFSVQKKFWEVYPVKGYVAQPVEKNGKPWKGSVHNRGAAVDLTLVDSEGNELPMPTGFDDFSEKAHRTYTGGDAQARANSLLLEQVMGEQGFTGIRTEWWHFNGPNSKSYGLMDIPFSKE